jgi:hypothetical protein
MARLFLLLAATSGAQSVPAQQARDFVFTDEEGHLVLRFAGVAPGALEQGQIDEIINVQMSTMVHDRLRADIEFEAESIDRDWAEPTQSLLERRLGGTDSGFAAVAAECRAVTCRIMLDHAATWTVAAHQQVMAAAQSAAEALIALEPARFQPAFLIAGQFQAPGTPYTKLFLRRLSSTAGTKRPDDGS